MPLITLRDVTAGFGGHPLLEDVSLVIEPGERAAVVGRNGAGKSTLLRVIEGSLAPDSGVVQRTPGVTVAWLAQTVPAEMDGTVFDVVAGGLGATGEAVATYHRLSVHSPESGDTEETLARAETALHDADAWGSFQRIETVVSRLRLDADAAVRELSAGMRRRVLLGRALARSPDLLLLDEPTNHLDIESIRWLEGFLGAYPGALIVVTHDRVFLEAVARRILDLDRGRLASHQGSWERYVERKQQTLDAEAAEERQFDKKLAEEEVWIRRGVKERRKRNMGRVRRLLDMRRERRERRERLGSARMLAQEAERTGRLVIRAKDVSFAYGDLPIVRGLSTTVQRGDRIGILGPNGVGKTTLLRLLLGEIAPDEGSVRHGTNLEVAYFDQLHAALDDTRRVQDNVADGADKILVGGKPRHVIGYLQDFLFSPVQARSLVSTLSGGERNRLLLARLFSRPSNVLVLDEPTNDLDTDTLELLEELLLDYSGTVLVVSHDRRFLDNVVTGTLVFEGDGSVKEYVGGYSDWLRQRPDPEAATPGRVPARGSTKAARSSKADAPAADAPRRLTYMEQKELEELPGRIERLESEKKELFDAMANPGFYDQDRARVDEVSRRLAELEKELEEAYDRWTGLEERAS